MPVSPEASHDELAPHQVMRRNYGLFARRLGLRVGIFGFLLALPLILGALGAPSAFWSAAPAAIGVIGLGFTFVNFKGHPFRLRKCGKVLDAYPLEPGTVTRIGKPTQTHNQSFYTLDVGRGEGAESCRMRAVEPQGLNRWPKGADDGVCIAGDLAFGGVIVVPGSNALLLMRPEPWDEAAPKRNAAAPDRRERAKKAGIELIPF
ncbi:hypothetical protein GCM10012287_23200 [Streptomyces daqingensis]|uniref:Uncharacterized protein n=1 Tax=Streptomyces daqingensis TaxID=1472640 RepID=A0ABQ2M958_9ACTN|nr:hypothetical protein [Streptomyces daqingensis]GGO48366.1 hypothetical protein GCM10012287_23200 [Streptomyces daqingensis]